MWMKTWRRRGGTTFVAFLPCFCSKRARSKIRSLVRSPRKPSRRCWSVTLPLSAGPTECCLYSVEKDSRVSPESSAPAAHPLGAEVQQLSRTGWNPGGSGEQQFGPACLRIPSLGASINVFSPALGCFSPPCLGGTGVVLRLPRGPYVSVA